jgi:hypothetical protein
VADRVPKITQAERPTFDAAVYSDRLQETRTLERNVSGSEAFGLAPVQVFDKASPSSIVPLAKYVRGLLTDRVNALSEFTSTQQIRLDALQVRAIEQDHRIDVLEAARPGFGSGSG